MTFMTKPNNFENPHSKKQDISFDGDFSTDAVPSIKAVVFILLQGKALHHHDVIQASGGTKHRLSIAISILRHKYGFDGLIVCPRAKDHPLKDHYYIATSNLPAARELAYDIGLIDIGV